MKVIEDIIEYLQRRGALSWSEVHALRESGFISPDWRDEPFWDADYDATMGPDSWEPLSDAPARKPRPSPSKRETTLKPAVLAARLRTAMHAGGAHVLALAAVAPVALAAGRADHAGLWDRIEAVARSTPEVLAGSIAEAVARGASFRALWDALGADVALGAVRAGERGPAASAYRALVALREERDLGSHRWILKRRPIARAYQFLRAQDRAAEGVHGVYRSLPSLFGQWIAQQHHPVAYWSFVLLYNAERLARGARWEPFAGEQTVRRPLPSPVDLAHASMRALQLGGAPVERFLHAFWTAEARADRLWWALAPKGAPPRVSLDWLRAALAADPAMSAGHLPLLLEALVGLRQLDPGPAERLVAQGLATREHLVERGGPTTDLQGPPVTLFSPSGWS